MSGILSKCALARKELADGPGHYAEVNANSSGNLSLFPQKTADFWANPSPCTLDLRSDLWFVSGHDQGGYNPHQKDNHERSNTL